MRIRDFKLRIVYLILGLRDRAGFPIDPREEIRKAGIKEGQTILDYGCGIGSYTIPAAKLVGKKGKVYALDKEQLATDKVKKRAQAGGLHNIVTILSDNDTGIPDASVDAVLLYGVLPEIEDKGALLKELHRILKPEGYLSTRYCFRIKRGTVLSIMAASGLYSLREENNHILNFEKKK